MPMLKAEDVKKDADAQKKKVAEIKKASKDVRRDPKLREARKTLRRLQRRWRQMTGRKNKKVEKVEAPTSAPAPAPKQ